MDQLYAHTHKGFEGTANKAKEDKIYQQHGQQSVWLRNETKSDYKSEANLTMKAIIWWRSAALSSSCALPQIVLWLPSGWLAGLALPCLLALLDRESPFEWDRFSSQQRYSDCGKIDLGSLYASSSADRLHYPIVQVVLNTHIHGAHHLHNLVARNFY